MAQVVSGRDILDPTRPRVYRLESRNVCFVAGVDLGPATFWGYSDPVASRFVVLSVDIRLVVDDAASSIYGFFNMYFGRGVPATIGELQAWEPFLPIRRQAAMSVWIYNAPQTHYRWEMGVEFDSGGYRFGLAGNNGGPGEVDAQVSIEISEG